MPKPTRFFLVRHGETVANREYRYVGRRDDALSAEGESQAASLGEAFAELAVSAVVSSPLVRCFETARRIAAARGLEIEVDDRLREQDYGAWEGLTRAEVLARSAGDRELLERAEKDGRIAPPRGESLQAVQLRLLGLVEELAARRAGEWLVLVSHVGPIKALLAAALEIPVASARRLFLDPATVTVIDWGDPSLVRLVNAAPHRDLASARFLRSAMTAASAPGSPPAIG
jgi:broad specificity phosphatase PhoE